MFSRPDNAALNPTPGTSRFMRPCTTMRPASGTSTPAIARTSVVLPAPLRPITAITEPRGTSNDTSFSAGTIRSPWRRERSRFTSAQSDASSKRIRYHTERSSTSIAAGRSSAGAGSDAGTLVTACSGVARAS